MQDDPFRWVHGKIGPDRKHIGVAAPPDGPELTCCPTHHRAPAHAIVVEDDAAAAYGEDILAAAAPHAPEPHQRAVNMSCQSAAGAEIVPALRTAVAQPAWRAPSGGDDDQDGQRGSQGADLLRGAGGEESIDTACDPPFMRSISYSLITSGR